MHVGIDGGCWSNRRGYGRFLRELLEAISRHDHKNEYTVFLDAGSYSEFRIGKPFRAVRVNTSESVAGAAKADGRRSLTDLFRMSRAVARERLDLFFFSSVYSYFPLLRRVPMVLGIHDTIADRNPHFSFVSRQQEFFWRSKVKLALAQADTILTVSEYSKRCIQETLHVPPSRVRVMYEAASPRFKPIDSGSSAEPYALYVGGISPNKNLRSLILAFGRLHSRLPRVKLLLAGDFKSDGFKGCHRQLCELVEALRLEHVVQFLGYVSDEELCSLYNRATLFVMPSLDEGFGLPAVEAMACGVPVLVSSGNSLAEVVGEAGIVVDPREEVELAEQMSRVFEDSTLASQLRRKSLKRATEFSWDTAAQSLLGIFEDTSRLRLQ